MRSIFTYRDIRRVIRSVFVSRLSFKAFCIEKYADYASIPSNKVYKLFEENGVIEMLNRDYDVLHGFGFEYIVRDIDEFMNGKPDGNCV